MSIISSYHALCKENGCRSKTGKYGSKRGLQETLDKAGWRSTIHGMQCPNCNPKTEKSWEAVQCNECGYETTDVPRHECPICEDGKLEAVG